MKTITRILIILATVTLVWACSDDDGKKPDAGPRDQGSDSAQTDLQQHVDGPMADQKADSQPAADGSTADGNPLEDSSSPSDMIADQGPTMTLTSTAFSDGQPIPNQYGCGGDNISPPLAWTNAPANTESFALIMDDPDAPDGTFVHWVIFDIPKTATSLAEDVDGVGVEGTNDFPVAAYGGPCPPSGTHHYYFKLYALSSTLGLSTTATKADLLNAMQGKVLGWGQLIGTYDAL